MAGRGSRREIKGIAIGAVSESRQAWPLVESLATMVWSG